jgi:hypothetical protein
VVARPPQLGAIDGIGRVVVGEDAVDPAHFSQPGGACLGTSTQTPSVDASSAWNSRVTRRTSDGRPTLACSRSVRASYRPLGETRHPSDNTQLPGIRVAERADCQR